MSARSDKHAKSESQRCRLPNSETEFLETRNRARSGVVHWAQSSQSHSSTAMQGACTIMYIVRGMHAKQSYGWGYLFGPISFRHFVKVTVKHSQKQGVTRWWPR